MRYLASLYLACLCTAPAWSAECGCTPPPGVNNPQPTCEVPGVGPGPAGCTQPGRCSWCPRRQTCQGQPCPSPCEGPPCGVERGGPPPSQPRGGPTPEEESVPRETGFFQAPPRVGAIQGPSRSVGVRLGSFTIPEITLRMPCFELPCLVRSHEAARMRISAAEAPWVSTGFERVGVGAVAGGAHAGTVEDRAAEDGRDRSRSAPAADCGDAKREYEAKLRDLQRKIDDCEKLRRCIEDCLRTYPQAPRPDDNPLPGDGPRRAVQTPDPPVPQPDPATSYDRRGPIRELQPASYTAPSPFDREAPRLLRLPSVSEARRLPAP
jgi:hypothetical protein